MTPNMEMMQDIEEVFFTERQIAVIVERIGKEISRDYRGKNLLLVSVLKGSVVFMADLMRSIDIPARIDFMATSSYGSGSENLRSGKDCEGSGYRAGGIRYRDCGGYSRQRQNAELPFGYFAVQEGREASASAPCSTSRNAVKWMCRPPIPAQRFPTPLLWATVSIMMKIPQPARS